ncbi:MAG: hypothetical protein ACRDBM_13995, partial [Sporomusa sp.]
MNKNKKWLLSLGIAVMLTASGIAMAAVAPTQQDGTVNKKHGAFERGDFRGKGVKEAHGELLALLKIDEQTFKAEIEAGKTLVAIAGEHGVSEQVLKDFLIAQKNQHLEDAIKAGRITAEQAEKMKANMDERMSQMINGKGPMHNMHKDKAPGPKAGHGFMGDAKLLELLKVDAETFRSELKSDKSLVTIAKEHGVSEKTLKKFMTTQMTQRIDEGVAAGRITAEQAGKMKDNMDERVSQMINGKGPMHNMHKDKAPGPKAGHGFMGDAKLLELLKIDAATLRTELKSDKTLVTIAKEQGVSEKTLKKFMTTQMTQRINEGVAANRITAEQAEKMKANMDERVSQMINSKGPMHNMHKDKVSGPKAGHGFMGDAKLLELLKLDAATLR